MSAFVSFNLNTLRYLIFFPFAESIYCKISARTPKIVFLGFQNFKLFLDFSYYAGYPAAGTKPLVRVWFINVAETP